MLRKSGPSRRDVPSFCRINIPYTYASCLFVCLLCFWSLDPIQHTLNPSSTKLMRFQCQALKEDPGTGSEKRGPTVQKWTEEWASHEHTATPRGHKTEEWEKIPPCTQVSISGTAPENKEKFSFLYWLNNTCSHFWSKEGDGVISLVSERCVSAFVMKDCHLRLAFLNALRQHVLLEGERNLLCFVEDW